MPWLLVFLGCGSLFWIICYFEKKGQEYNDFASWQDDYDQFYSDSGYKPYAWRKYRKKK